MVYVRTLSNLSSPSEVRNLLQIGRRQYDRQDIPADLITFAQYVLPFKYDRLVQISKRESGLLIAKRADSSNAQYSEFHMSSGERAVLRLSLELSKLKNALVLIDEIEAGLHPHTQQELMLQLQRQALRNQLQIVATTHSPVILDSVPPEARLFLDRNELTGEVRSQPAYQPLIQRALYGQSIEKLTILCEDKEAKSLVLGVAYSLLSRFNLEPDDLSVGHDSSRTYFPQYVQLFGQMNQLDRVIFILDGDARSDENQIKKAANNFSMDPQLLFLPGTQSTETWVWRLLNERPSKHASLLGLTEEGLLGKLKDIDRTYANASDRPAEIHKNKLSVLCDNCNHEVPNFLRELARIESEPGGALYTLRRNLATCCAAGATAPDATYVLHLKSNKAAAQRSGFFL